ncbi:MAG: Na/Pi cotransporter family protein, partial [Clostridia bacterium]|nr:Na/Pi cotransporter family protein [Clostridia bacterium]
PDISDVDINKTYNLEMEINNYRNMLRNANMENINNKVYEYRAGIHFMDIILECEKLADYVVNVIDAVREKRSLKQ